MPTHADLWQHLLQGLSQVASPVTETDWLFEHLTGLTPLQRRLAADHTLAPELWFQAQQLLTRRQAHEPLQYLLGHTWFYGIKLKVTPDVLIPRPETEELVDWVLGQIPPEAAWTVVDMATGSGAMAIAIAQQRPHCQVWASDISDAALVVAQANALQARLEQPIHFVQGDRLQPLMALDLQAQVLVCNPPYISAAEFDDLQVDVRDYEPRLALVAEGDPLLFYQDLAAHLPQVLAPGAVVAVEIHDRFARETEACFAAYPYCQEIRCRRDMQQMERFVTLRYHRTDQV